MRSNRKSERERNGGTGALPFQQYPGWPAGNDAENAGVMSRRKGMLDLEGGKAPVTVDQEGDRLCSFNSGVKRQFLFCRVEVLQIGQAADGWRGKSPGRVGRPIIVRGCFHSGLFATSAKACDDDFVEVGTLGVQPNHVVAKYIVAQRCERKISQIIAAAENG